MDMFPALSQQEKIELARIRIFLNSPMSMVALLVLPALSAVVLWNFLPHGLILGWVVFVYLAGTLRIFSWLQLRRMASSDNLPLIRRRVTFSIIVMGIMGTAWGILGMGLGLADDARAEVYIVLVIFGVSAGAVFTSSAWPPAVMAYLLPMLVPFSLSVFARLDWYFAAIGVGVLLYLMLIVSYIRQYNIWLDQFIRLQVHNDLLVGELTVARDAATEASRAKSRFLANISHELRTPLNSILGFSEVIRDSTNGTLDAPTLKEYSGYIHDSGEYLLRLINDILDYSKIEAAKMELSPAPMSVRDAIQACLSMIRQMAAQKKLSLVFDNDRDCVIIADELRVRQILMNLLSNAVKFTPDSGTITVSLSEQAGTVEIKVRDTGIGMTAEELVIAMEPFGQAAGAKRGGLQGTGLGLPLAKSLAELHGGTFHISSTPGQGTTVMFSLPKKAVKHDPG